MCVCVCVCVCVYLYLYSNASLRGKRLRQRCIARCTKHSISTSRTPKCCVCAFLCDVCVQLAVATAMRRYAVHTPQSVACVSFVYLCVRELGDCSYDSDASLRGRSGYLRRRYVATRYVRSWRLRQQCVATRTNDYATAMRNASLRARKMFYFCYADGAVATAMRRYIHVNVIFLLHTPQSVACVSFVYLYLRELGDFSYDSDASLRGRNSHLRRRYVATRYVRIKPKMFCSISTSHAPKRHSAGRGDERGGTRGARQRRLFTINVRRRL